MSSSAALHEDQQRLDAGATIREMGAGLARAVRPSCGIWFGRGSSFGVLVSVRWKRREPSGCTWMG